MLPSLQIISQPEAELLKNYIFLGALLYWYMNAKFIAFKDNCLLCLVQLPVLLEKSKLYVLKTEGFLPKEQFMSIIYCICGSGVRIAFDLQQTNLANSVL